LRRVAGPAFAEIEQREALLEADVIVAS